ncbi:MAG: regulatory signaling modulator protein AmpE [Nevskiales bacterium]|nr:regulatory signaling modulator protein AmpE [Nevskiales bacterium]
MTLIGILLALLGERLLGHLPRFGEPLLLRQIVVGVQGRVSWPAYWRSAAAPAVLLVAATAGMVLLDWVVRHPLPDLALEVVVLLLCLGSRHLDNDIQRLIEAREANDTQAERLLTLVLLRGPERNASRRSLIGALFIQSHERLFGVLLWFIAAGPAGAVLYRLASHMPRFLYETQPGSKAEQMAVQLHAVAAWIPARITAVLFGLAGSLDQALAEWRRQQTAPAASWWDRTWALLAEMAAASLSTEEGAAGPVVPAALPDCLREVRAMQVRVLLILLAAFGLFTAGGWMA